MIIKIFQANFGDAISINFYGNDNKYHNIFIDGGFASTYDRTIRAETLRIIKDKQRIDSFIITHIDQDHISGAICFIKEFCKENIVNEFWFNTNLLININTSNLISYSEAIKARDYLNDKNQLVKTINDATIPFETAGAVFTFLSPSKKDLSKFHKKWKKYENNLISAIGNDYKYTIEDLAKREFNEDPKLENKVSISFLFEKLENKILFLADSHPITIINKLFEMGYSKSNKLNLDYMKISHHGSKGNTNYQLLDMINCKNYIISADGLNRYYLPHKETLSRIIHHNKLANQNINIIFNYNNPELNNIFSEEDKLKYDNFTCLFPKENENAYIIRF